MHEYSIVGSLLDRVQREVALHRGAVARKLHVRIGELAGVEIELLKTAYNTFGEGAELVIEQVPARWRCAMCGRVLPAGAILRCCGRPAKLDAGDDIILERIEMEVSDV